MKNILVEYKGGGYEGCYWQWNYFMFNHEGEFINILSTGYKGIKREEQAIEMIKDEQNRPDVRILDLSNLEEVVDFVNDGNAGNMLGLAKFSWELEEQLIGNCCNCGLFYHVIDMLCGDYSSDGGIVVSPKNLYCEECFWSFLDVEEEE